MSFLSRLSGLTLVSLATIGVAHPATIATQHFSIYAPSANIPPAPYIEVSSSGSFSFDYSLIEDIPIASSRTFPLSDLTSFNLSGSVNGTSTRTGQPTGSSSFTFGLGDLTAFTFTAINRPNSAGVGHLEIYNYTFTTRPVAGSNPDFGDVAADVRYAYTIVGADIGSQNIFGLNQSPATATIDGFLVLTPEPSTFGLIGLAGLGVLALARKRHSGVKLEVGT